MTKRSPSELEADLAYQAKMLERVRDGLIFIDELEDEDDRVFFASTNHADHFRELFAELGQWDFERAVWPAEGRDLYAEISELRTTIRATGWQPIETAPRDGTIIDVWRDGSRETVYWGFRPHECGEMGQYCDSDWHSETKPGWVCSTFGEFVGSEHDPFTNWMPLPDAPPPPTPEQADRT